MILSYKTDGSMLRVVTDNPGRSEFVYPVGKFSSLEQLEAEIGRSVSAESVRSSLYAGKLSVLSSELVSRGAVDATPVKDEVVR